MTTETTNGTVILGPEDFTEPGPVVAENATTDALDLDALETRLEHHAHGARRIPAEPLFSIAASTLRALIAAARQRDELCRDLRQCRADGEDVTQMLIRRDKECEAAVAVASSLRSLLAKAGEAMAEAEGLFDGIIEGDYTPDSFTAQPLRTVLAEIRATLEGAGT